MSAASRAVPHLPILRKGRPYKSLDVQHAVHYRTKEPVAEVSQANLRSARPTSG
jgi:hypothetical protein